MFTNDRYITRGIKEKINQKNPVTFLLLWDMVDKMEVEKKDYLQVFNLRVLVGERPIQVIEHEQEEPPYKGIFRYYTENPVSGKIYIIDDGEHSTMLLAEEY